MPWSLQLLKREPGQISFPIDFKHTITVQQIPVRDESKLRTDTPPGSPAASRFRAIARKWTIQYNNNVWLSALFSFLIIFAHCFSFISIFFSHSLYFQVDAFNLSFPSHSFTLCTVRLKEYCEKILVYWNRAEVKKRNTLEDVNILSPRSNSLLIAYWLLSCNAKYTLDFSKSDNVWL